MAEVEEDPIGDLTYLSLESESSSLDKWTTKLPPELIYRTIARFLPTDIPALQSLSVTCQALHAFCRPLIFEVITFHKESPPSVSGTTKAERFARLLSHTPEIAALIKAFRFFSLPVSPYGSQHIASIDEESYCYILTQKYPSLTAVQIDDKPLSWDYLTPKLQASVLHLLRKPSLERVFIALRTYPIAVLEQSPKLTHLSLCGHIMPTTGYTSRIIPIDEKVQPQGISMCHVPDESLPLLSGGSATFEPQNIQLLNLGETRSFSFHHYNLVRSCGPSLTSIQIRVSTLVGAVPIPMGSLPKLRNMLVSIESREIYIGLEWYSISLDTRSSPDFGEAQSLGLGLRTDTLSPEAAFDYHKALWLEASKEQNRWPNLANICVGGFSLAPAVMRNGQPTIEMECLGPYKTGGHDHSHTDEAYDHTHGQH